MNDGSFQPADPVGLETLQHFAGAEKFNRWLYESVAPWCNGSVLEIGSGIGNISKFLFDKTATRVTLSDFRKDYCNILQQRFAEKNNLEGVFQMDMADENFTTKYSALLEKFDTVVALNIIEHINDDQLAIRNCKSLLKKSGTLIILVPAFQTLYNSLDKELGHCRRYNKKSLSAVLVREDMQVTHRRFFNTAGIFGWMLSGSLLRKKLIPHGQLVVFNRLVPFFRLIDKLFSHVAGLSVIAISKK